MARRSLPRADKGDWEEYAMTMLMLFKPGGWREGRDLLGSFPSFSAAFDHTSFDSGALDIMKNMNILYECLDARDDYSAQRRAALASAPHGEFVPGEYDNLLSGSDDIVVLDGEYEYTETSLLDFIDGGAVGPKTAKHRKETVLVRSSLPLDVVVSATPSVAHVRRPYPKRSNVEWKLVVSKAKQAYIERHQHIEPSQPEMCVGSEKASQLRRHLLGMILTFFYFIRC
ncbi:hypothetical protein VTO73DRAFT_6160 [Trametes versicolor]